MYPVRCPLCAGRQPDCPACCGRGLVLATDLPKLSGMGDIWSSAKDVFSGKAFKSAVKKVTAQVKRSMSDVGKVVKQIPRYPTKLVKQTATQVQEHKKELVAIGSAAAGTAIAIASGGTALPLAAGIAGAGIGSTRLTGGGFGKPKDWGIGALIGGAAGYGAGSVAGGLIGPGGWSPAQAAIWKDLAPGWTTYNPASGLFESTKAVAGEGASQAAAGSASTGLEIAGGATPATQVAAMEIAPAVATPAAQAAAAGVPWSGISSAITAGLGVASQVLGGGAGAAGVPVGAGLAPGIQIDASQGTPYYDGGYGSGGALIGSGGALIGSGGAAGGAAGGESEFVSPEESEITPPSAELVSKALSGKLTTKEWLVYGAIAAGLTLGAAALLRRSRRRKAQRAAPGGAA